MASTFNTTPKDPRPISIALAKYTRLSWINPHRRRDSAGLGRRGSHVTTVFPVEIWLSILEHLEENVCIYQKHNDLYSLSLTCKLFNELAFRVLYETLDLQFIGTRDLDPLECTCLIHREDIGTPKSRILHVLRKKLSRLLSTIRSRPDIASQIQYLKLPNKHFRLQTPNSFTRLSKVKEDIIYSDIFLKLFQIFKLCSTRLHSASGLGFLWSEPRHRFISRTKLRNEVWKAVTNSSSWTHWDFTSWNDPSLLEKFQRSLLTWKDLEHVTLFNTAWTNGALHLLPSLQSINIHTDCRNDFGDIFPHVPTKNLRSLSYRCLEDKSHLMGNPFESFIDYLKDSHLQAIYSTPPTSQTLTKIDINFIWQRSLRKPLGTISFNELAICIFTFVPLLRDLKIVIANRHRERLFWTPDYAQDPRENLVKDNQKVVARHLRAMSISVPACVAKYWLAEKITSRAFPILSDFTFRSALNRGHNGCKCTVGTLPKGLEPFQESLKKKLGVPPTNIFVFQTYLKSQDKTLVHACRKAAIPNWKMAILKNTAETCCIFAIDDEVEDATRSIYSRTLGSTGEMGYETSPELFGGTICEVADF